MVLFEGYSLIDSLWLSITTITTIGYGDISAQTISGRLSTIILLYGGGIILLWELLSEYLNYKIIKRDRIIKGEHPRRYVLFLENYKLADIVCALINEDLGTAMAEFDKKGETFPHPWTHEIICAVGLILRKAS